MRHFHFLIVFSSFVLISFGGCGAWNKEPLQPNTNLQIAQTELEFVYGETQVKQIFTKSLQLTNTGTTILIIDSVSSSHPLNFGAKELYGQIIIKPNESKNLPIQFMAKDYGDYSGKITLHTETSGNKEIPVNIRLDCAVDNATFPFVENEISVCSQKYIPFGNTYTPQTNFNSNYCAMAGTFAEIQAFDENSGYITIKWRRKYTSYPSIDNGTVKAILTDEMFGVQESANFNVSATDSMTTFYFNFTPNTISKNKVMLIFDVTYNGTTYRYFSGTVPFCI